VIFLKKGEDFSSPFFTPNSLIFNKNEKKPQSYGKKQ